MKHQSNSQTMVRKRRSRRDPSEGGWDTSIVVAPDSHKSSKHGAKRKRRHHRRRWPRVVAGVLVAVVLVAGLGIGAAFAYLNTLDNAMSLGQEADEIKGALTDVPASQPFYLLVLGSDMREGLAAERLEAAGQENLNNSDVMMLVRVDATNARITLLSVPRDTAYTYPDGQIRKINYLFSTSGPAGSIQAVEELAGVRISHYVEVRRSGLKDLVDELGGISVDVPLAFDTTTIAGDTVHVDAGLQRLDGAQALALANMRRLYDAPDTGQDAMRQSAAREVVAGIVEAVRNRPLVQLPGAVASAASCVKTDMSTAEIVEIARIMGAKAAVYSGSAPFAGDLDPYVNDPAYADTDGHPWLCYVNEAGWQRVMSLVDAGEDPAQASYGTDVVHYAGQPEATWDQGLVEPE